jgi:hypothetical protein
MFFMFLSANNGWTQSLISTAGDVFSGNDLQWEWSLGEPVIDTYADQILFTQGFHQPDIKLKPEEEFSCEVYPNPYDIFLIVKISKLESENMYCQITDICGKIVLIMQNLKEYNEFMTSDMPDGIYVLRLFDSKSRLMKIAKIVKLYQT